MKFEIVLNAKPFLSRSRYLAHAARYALEGLVQANQMWIRARRKMGHATPLPYAAGVRYQMEPDNGVEEFADIATTWARGWGDCDDLASWVCAWRREHGENCGLRITWRRTRSGRRIFHVTVRRADGSIEDPSKLLGMPSGAA